MSRLEAAQHFNQLESELRRLERYHLLVVDELGYLSLSGGEGAGAAFKPRLEVPAIEPRS